MELEGELAEHPGSGAASFWLVAATRAQGDLQAAWDAAQAGWVDRIVLRVLGPERTKVLAQPPENLKAEWERFKARWEKTPPGN